MIKIALTGADGLVGSRITELLKNEFLFTPLPQSAMDITDKQAVDRVIKSTDFDILLHLAAFTNVAGAETNKDLCYRINVEGTKNISEAVESKNKKMIYISTDFVFDGKNPPFDENSVPNPSGVYAVSKYEGEKILGGRSMIIRISYPYRAAFDVKKDFFRTFKSLLEQKKPLTMITDSLMTPTFVDDIAFGLKHLIQYYTPGIFHLVGSRSYSPYDAAVLVAEKFNLDKTLIGKTTYEEYIKLKPGLPKLADIRSIKNNFWKMRSFEEGLEEIINQTA